MPDPAPEHYTEKYQPPVEPHTIADAGRGAPTNTPLPSKQVMSGLAVGDVVADRYMIQEPVAEGGMGAVLRVFDRKLQRELALKVMKRDAASSPELVRRFLDEARVCGRLQHPGVVPLHEIGELADGRPFFTMKLIRGRTLSDMLKERARNAEGYPLTADLPRFVQIFEQICQAVAYAHSQGIIHRDLKPLNVMVGAFGEVQVMDWGLAKEIESRTLDNFTVSPDTQLSERDTGLYSFSTQTGHAMGTPAYMPPEQALGDVGNIDRRADVFSLGATLCEVLTAMPPYGSGKSDPFIQARNGAIGPALERLANCGGDADLVAIARSCLQLKIEDRPADAAAVTNLVTNYLAGVESRLRKAQEERAAAQARAEEAQGRARAERRARRLTVAFAAAFMLLLASGGGAAWWIGEQRAAAKAKQEHANNSAQREMDEVLRMRREAREAEPDPAKFQAAVDRAALAVSLAKDGGSVETIEAAEQLLAQLERDVVQAKKNRALLAALLDVRQPRETKTYEVDEEGAMTAVSEPSLEEQFRVAFSQWGIDIDASQAEVAANRLAQEPERVIQELIAGLDEWAFDRKLQGKTGSEWRTLSELSDRLDTSISRRGLRRIRLSDALAYERLINELTTSLMPWCTLVVEDAGENRRELRNLVRKLDPKKEPVFGILALHRALAAAGDAAGAESVLRSAITARPGDVHLLVTLGEWLEKQDPPQWGRAIECYQAARAIRPQLGVSLSKVLRQEKRLREAELLCRELVERERANPELYFYLGNALRDQENHVASEYAFREAIRLRPNYSQAHHNHGLALRRQRRYPEAEEAYREAIRLQPDDHLAHNNLGIVLDNQGKYSAGEAAFREAIRLRPDNHLAHCNLGIALRLQKKYALAELALRAAIRLRPDYSLAHYNLGYVLTELKRNAEAELEFRLAIRLRPDYVEAHNFLGQVLLDLGRNLEAEFECRNAIRLRSDFADAHNNLGRVLIEFRRYSEAEAVFREALRLQPEFAEAHNNLGVALRGQGKHEEAQAAYREAVRLRPEFPEAHNNLGIRFEELGKYVEAEAAYREAVRIRPTYENAHCNLGDALRLQRKYSEAEQVLLKADQLILNSPSIQQKLSDVRKLLDFDRRLPSILNGNASPASALEATEMADYCLTELQRPLAAFVLYAAAFRIDANLLDDLDATHRYTAGCAGVRAVTGPGEDIDGLFPEECHQLQRQARLWIRADLDEYEKQSANKLEPKQAKEIAENLEHWLQDTDLAGVRDPKSLAAFPDDERREWEKLWADVDALLKKLTPDKK